jgi:hypothetical protein
VILAITGAAAGTLFGAVVQALLGSPLDLVYLTVGVLCLLVIGLTTTLIGTIDTSRQSQDAVLQRIEATSSELRDVVGSSTREVERSLSASREDLGALVARAGEETREFLLDLSRQASLRVRSQSVAETNRYRSPDEDLVVRAFRKAHHEILALDRLTSTGVRPDVAIDPEKMRWHLDAIEERVQAGVRYHRMLQVDDGWLRRPFQALRKTLEGGGLENVFAHHCARMAGWTTTRPDVVLKVARYFFPYKFLIIDGRTLILQLHQAERLGGSVEPRTVCELVINDPQEAFIGQFVKMWRAVDADTATRALSLSDKDLASFQQADGRT